MARNSLLREIPSSLNISRRGRRRPLFCRSLLKRSARKPPDAAAEFKALEYDAAAEGPTGRLANRVGGMLGLRVQSRDSKIFISYRATDGAAIATQLHNHLVGLGHHVFLDEAKEIDGRNQNHPGQPRSNADR